MRLILGSNISRPTIRDVILISSGAGYCNNEGNFNLLTHNRMLLKHYGRNEYAKAQYRVKYGGKFGDRLKNFGNKIYNNVIKPGFNRVVKPVYNATKKLVDIAANNELANNAIKIVGNTVGAIYGAPGVGNAISSAIQGADTGIKIGESVVNRLITEKKLDPEDITQIINIIKEQIKEFTGNDKKTLDNKVNTVKDNLKDIDLEKENLTKEDITSGFKAGLIFYNPVSRKPINKYSGRVKMAGSIKPINPNLLKIMPKLFRKKTLKSIKKDIVNNNTDIKNSKGESVKNGRVKMSGNISNSQMNEISNKLEALKAKYK